MISLQLVIGHVKIFGLVEEVVKNAHQTENVNSGLDVNQREDPEDVDPQVNQKEDPDVNQREDPEDVDPQVKREDPDVNQREDPEDVDPQVKREDPDVNQREDPEDVDKLFYDTTGAYVFNKIVIKITFYSR